MFNEVLKLEWQQHVLINKNPRVQKLIKKAKSGKKQKSFTLYIMIKGKEIGTRKNNNDKIKHL